jgi:hypothetical protein
VLCTRPCRPDDRFPTTPVLAAGPLDALAIYHRDGLMSGAVRLRDGRIEFRDRADQELCQGPWEVTRHTRDGPAETTTVMIPAPGEGGPETGLCRRCQAPLPVRQDRPAHILLAGLLTAATAVEPSATSTTQQRLCSGCGVLYVPVLDPIDVGDNPLERSM